MRVLMIGDVIGKPGRNTVQELLPKLRQELYIDLVIANGENSAGGAGITKESAKQLLSSGVDVITSGNHVWDKEEIIPELDGNLPILRPLNYPPTNPGTGYIRLSNVLIVNLIGRVFVGSFDCPFRTMENLLKELEDIPKIIIIDMHAEATSEKAALSWYFDGQVSAIAGTHTHVPTADERILPKGTAFVSDLGMVGPTNSIIGVEPEGVIQRFLTQTNARFRVSNHGPTKFNSVMIDIDENTGNSTSIARVDREIK